MNDAPLVSVIMNCYNSAGYLKEAIQSVGDQTYQSWEIVFWDNRSTDGSATIVASFNDDRIKYFLADMHTGLGEARNAALARCTGKYVAFLDCDDIWFSDKLMKQVQMFESLPNIGFIHGNYFMLDMEGNRRYLFFKTTQPEGMIFEHFLTDFRISLSTVMIRKSVLINQNSFFDTKLHLTEEYELFMRILFSSLAAYIHDPIAIYRIHSGMNSRTQKDRFVDELKYCYAIFRSLDTTNRYSDSLRILEYHIDAVDAGINMSQGNLHRARTLISSHKFRKFLYLVMYMATYLPVPVWFFLRPIWRRFRPSIS